ncbi:MAG: glycosyltransferase family 4 protein [Anaerolineales bacterium]|nr:glycosyltransferase family 4 protein [Anaerolineales bacterium]
MRILFVSNVFPPFARGGYEQWCDEVATALVARGHELVVLTSTPPAQSPIVDDRPFEIRRRLHQQVEGGLGNTVVRILRDRARLEAQDLQTIDEIKDSFQPDAVLVWGMWNLNLSVPEHLEQCFGDRIAYYFCDYWPTLESAYVQRFQEPARHRPLQAGKSALGRLLLPQLDVNRRPDLAFARAYCVSAAVRRILVARGAPLQGAQVLYGGIDGSAFAAAGAVRKHWEQGLRLLYAGRIEPMKGVHTIVGALVTLRASGHQDMTLDIVGGGDPDYMGDLQRQVEDGGLSQSVRMLGPVKRDDMPALMAQYDVLVFSSEWEEPFARTVMEAMASGLLVVGTLTGGTGELLVEGETGLTYRAGDAADLARQLLCIEADAQRAQRVASHGQRVVLTEYTLVRMVDDFEAMLASFAPGGGRQPSLQTVMAGNPAATQTIGDV